MVIVVVGIFCFVKKNFDIGFILYGFKDELEKFVLWCKFLVGCVEICDVVDVVIMDDKFS